MKFLIRFIVCLIVIEGICSCAHKSGHKQQNVTIGAQLSDNEANKTEPQIIVSDKPAREKMTGSQIFAKYGTAVFMVLTSDGYNICQGSGFFIGPNGLAVSNYHVFQGTSMGDECIKLPGSDNVYKVTEVIANSEDEDFILFRVNISNANYIPIAKYKPAVGEKVYAIGSPRGLENTFSSGEVSQWRGENLMQISALIDHGSSGGALINERGEAVGLTSGTFVDGSQANLNYAWSIDAIKPYLSIER